MKFNIVHEKSVNNEKTIYEIFIIYCYTTLRVRERECDEKIFPIVVIMKEKNCQHPLFHLLNV